MTMESSVACFPQGKAKEKTRKITEPTKRRPAAFGSGVAWDHKTHKPGVDRNLRVHGCSLPLF